MLVIEKLQGTLKEKKSLQEVLMNKKLKRFSIFLALTGAQGSGSANLSSSVPSSVGSKLVAFVSFEIKISH